MERYVFTESELKSAECENIENIENLILGGANVRTINTIKKRINITSIFIGEQSITEKLFIIADRRLKNIDVTITKAG